VTIKLPDESFVMQVAGGRCAKNADTNKPAVDSMTEVKVDTYKTRVTLARVSARSGRV